MRACIMLGVGALMLATVALPSGARGATMDDVKSEMEKTFTPVGTRLEMRVPMVVSGAMHMSITDLCVSGGVLRSTGGGAPTIDMGPVRPGNQYSVLVVRRFPLSATGDEIFLYERRVSLPECK